MPSSLLLVATLLVLTLVTTPPTGLAAPIFIPRPSFIESTLRLLAPLPRLRWVDERCLVKFGGVGEVIAGRGDSARSKASWVVEFDASGVAGSCSFIVEMG